MYVRSRCACVSVRKIKLHRNIYIDVDMYISMFPPSNYLFTCPFPHATLQVRSGRSVAAPQPICII
jgi:hypothetical protein